jgi:hypothetical protein
MRLARAALFIAILGAMAPRAEALPLLQLDMQNGEYDAVSKTIVAPGGGPFTLYALLSPKASWSEEFVQSLLNVTYYVTAAVTPGVATPTSLGSFTFGASGTTPTTVDVTSGMTFGTPPIEVIGEMQGHDPGDLGDHDTFPTYFRQFAFQFEAANRSVAYDTALNPGGPTPSATGTAYFAAFVGDTSLLDARYELHFDLFQESLLNCNNDPDTTCRDADVDLYADFSHDAGTSHSVPEPMTAAGMLVGVATCCGFRRRRNASAE